MSETPELRGGIIRIAQSDNEESNREIAVIQKDPNTELATIPDTTLRKTCEKNKWIVVIVGDPCGVLEAGLTSPI